MAYNPDLQLEKLRGERASDVFADSIEKMPKRRFPATPPPKEGLAKKIKKILLGYKPWPLQKMIHLALRRFNVLVCHRRFGKSELAIGEMIDRALRNPLPDPTYAYIGPTYKQAKRIAWKRIINYTRNLPGVRVNKQDLTVYVARPHRRDPLTGLPAPDEIALMVVGADEPDSLRGIYLDGAILDEYAQCDPIIWSEVIRFCLADRGKIAQDLGVTEESHPGYKLPWAVFIGTPKGRNHFFRRKEQADANVTYTQQYEREHNIDDEREAWKDFENIHKLSEFTPPVEAERILDTLPQAVVKEYEEWRRYLSSSQWYTTVQKASETGVLRRSEIDEIKQDIAPEEVEQELECSFEAAIKGSFFGHLLNQARKDGRIGKFPYNPAYPVDTFWDLGVGDKAVIWFRQKINEQYFYIDYYEMNGKGVPHYQGVLDAKASAVGSVRIIDEDSDKEMKGRGFKYGRHVWPHDGDAREWSSGETRRKTAETMGLRVEIQQKQSVEDRIDASRKRIQVAFFDEEHCDRGLECLYDYQKEWDGKMGVYKKTPVHNWASHGSDGFGYSALDNRGSSMYANRNSSEKLFADSGYDELGYGQESN